MKKILLFLWTCFCASTFVSAEDKYITMTAQGTYGDARRDIKSVVNYNPAEGGFDCMPLFICEGNLPAENSPITFDFTAKNDFGSCYKGWLDLDGGSNGANLLVDWVENGYTFTTPSEAAEDGKYTTPAELTAAELLEGTKTTALHSMAVRNKTELVLVPIISQNQSQLSKNHPEVTIVNFAVCEIKSVDEGGTKRVTCEYKRKAIYPADFVHKVVNKKASVEVQRS